MVKNGQTWMLDGIDCGGVYKFNMSTKELSAKFHPPASDSEKTLAKILMLSAEEHPKLYEHIFGNSSSQADNKKYEALFTQALVKAVPGCLWSSQVKTWLDANQNGKFEESELPLVGVTVHADDTVNRFIRVDTKVTNDRGLAFLSVFLPGCPKAEFQVYEDPPPGFRLTNSPRVSAPYNGTIHFGFVKTQN